MEPVKGYETFAQVLLRHNFASSQLYLPAIGRPEAQRFQATIPAQLSFDVFYILTF